MAGRPEAAHRREVAPRERVDRLGDADVLGDDVPASPERLLVHQLAHGGQHRRGDVPQGLDRRVVAGEGGHRRLALGPSHVVLARGQAPRRAGVDRHQGVRGEGQGDRPPGERPAVEEHRRSGNPAGAGELVHEAAVDPDVGVLGALADPGELQRRDGRGVLRQGPRRGQLQGRRRREARSAGQRRGEAAPEAASGDAGLRERPCRAGQVAGHPGPAGPDRVEVEGRPVARRRADQLDPPIGRGLEGDPDLEVDGGRQDVALVVVGVLADEVDPAGSADGQPVRGAPHRAVPPAGTTVKPGCSSRGVRGIAWRWAALASGSVSLMNSRVDVSTEARTLVSRFERWGG